jgi:mannose-1-phosphate guanylyltransferase
MDRPVVAVVLAGGIGSRLYPASRSHRPKQFRSLTGDASLLTRTVDRVGFADATLVVTRPAFEDAAREHARAALDAKPASTPDDATLDGDRGSAVRPGSSVEVLVEPAGRDTGPAVAYATHVAAERFASADAEPVVLVCPSDHLVRGAFEPTARRALRAAGDTGSLVTLGVEPTRPETGFGYVEPGGARGDHFRVVAFHEKPDVDTAERYVEAGYLWNAGIFAWTPAAFRRAARGSPLDPLVNALDAGDPAGGFAAVDPVSVDYAVLERADDVAVVPVSFAWDDLGSWDALRRVLPRETDDGAETGDDNAVLGDALAIDAAGNVVAADEDTHVSLVGVEGLVVAAFDDRVLVVPVDEAQRVREVVDRLRAEGTF